VQQEQKAARPVVALRRQEHGEPHR
jgi:hypothetical protein